MMAIKLHNWRTIRELRLCTAAGLINPLEFKILLAPQVFLNQGEEDDDEEDDEPVPIKKVTKTKKKKESKEELTPAIGFHFDEEDEEGEESNEDEED